RFLELLVDVLPADHRDRILARREKLRHRSPVQAIAFVLEVAQGVQLAAGIPEALEPSDRLVELPGAPTTHLRLLLRMRTDRLHTETDDVAGRLVHVIANVVDRGR